MSISAEQLAAGANTQMQAYASNDPIDQFTTMRPTAAWLIANRKEVTFGNGIFNEKVRITNDSNFQTYTGDGQVTYNRKKTTKLAPFYHYDHHDGFALNETELADNGVTLVDDRNANPTENEQIQIVSLLKEGFDTLKDGFQEQFAYELFRDGTASSLAIPGIDALISTVPTTTTVAGYDGSVAANAWWLNNVHTGITGAAGTLLAQMEIEWRKCITYGKLGAPDFIPCGSKFIDAYAADVRAQPGTSIQYVAPVSGGVKLDGSRSGCYFHGVELTWDPVMDLLQAADDPTVDWDKRCYFLNSKALTLRPNKGRWLINRKPSRMYDRYVYYFGLTTDAGLTSKKRNSMSVMSIA
jgi:hypothetical protein